MRSNLFRSLRSYSAVVCATFFFLVANSLSAATLHGILLCDTIADKISASVAADLAKVRQELQKVRAHTDLGYKEKVFTGPDLNANVLQWIKDTEVGADDVVVIFFSGHGFRTGSKTDNVWPNVYFSAVNKGVDFYLLVQLLHDKSPRLLLAIADCCNNVLPEAYAPELMKGKKTFFAGVKKPDVFGNYRRLFLESSGVIIISSSEPKEFSWGTRFGGLYTLAFFDSLKSELNSFDPNWRVLLDRASMKVIKRNVGQTPQFELKLN